MINILLEKNLAFSTSEVYGILTSATEAADDAGFVNSFIFERALYVYAAIVLYKDEELINLAAKDMNEAWTYLLHQDGTLEDMIAQHEDSLNYIAELGQDWIIEYEQYKHSTFTFVQELQKMLGNMAGTFEDVIAQSGVAEAIQTGKKWGMDAK